MGLPAVEDARLAGRLADRLFDQGDRGGELVPAGRRHGDEAGELHVGVAGNEGLLADENVLVLLGVGEVEDLADLGLSGPSR